MVPAVAGVSPAYANYNAAQPGVFLAPTYEYIIEKLMEGLASQPSIVLASCTSWINGRLLTLQHFEDYVRKVNPSKGVVSKLTLLHA